VATYWGAEAAKMQMNFLKTIAILILLVRGSCLDVSAVLSLENGICSVTFDPASLRVELKDGHHPAVTVSIAQTNLGSVVGLKAGTTNASWTLPEKHVAMALCLNGRVLQAHVQADQSEDFTFPIISPANSAKAWILPMFEGVYVPCGDAKWASFLTNYGPMNTTADLTMPFVGLDGGGFTLTYIFDNPFNNHLEFHQSANHPFEARFTH
jgi:hypothetical protein